MCLCPLLAAAVPDQVNSARLEVQAGSLTCERCRVRTSHAGPKPAQDAQLYVIAAGDESEDVSKVTFRDCDLLCEVPLLFLSPGATGELERCNSVQRACHLVRAVFVVLCVLLHG